MRVNTLILLFCVLFFYLQYELFAQTAGLTIPSSSIQNDPNLDPNWDWRIGDFPDRIYPDAGYKIYHQADNGSIIPVVIQAPWTQANAWGGLLDNKQEDGWILLVRDFGTSSRPMTGLNAERPPYFVLYNKYRAILRLFVNIQNSETWNRGFIELKFKDPSDLIKTPAVLAHLLPIAKAIDKAQLMKENVSSVYSEVLRKNNWLWADFPLSYDPTTIQKSDLDPPSFYFRIYGQEIKDIELKGISEGAQGNAHFVNNWLTGAINGNGPFGISNLDIPNLKFKPNAIDISLGELNLKPFGTQTNWNSFKEYFSKIAIKLPSVVSPNPFKGIFDGYLSKFSNFVNVLPINLPGLDIGGLFDFFVNGGAKSQNAVEPAPSFIAMNLELGGRITATLPVHEIRVTIPNTRLEFWQPSLGSTVGIVNNDPVGLISLIKTPTVYKNTYLKNLTPNNPYGWIERFTSYIIGDYIYYKVNNQSNLVLYSLDISLVGIYSKPSAMDFTEGNAQFVYNWLSKPNYYPNHLIQLESPVSEDRIIIKSMPVPVRHALHREIHFPYGTDSDIKIKMKATFQRKDDPNAQKVVFISTYDVNIIENASIESESYQITIPPQLVNCSYYSADAVRISWSKNLESNIKLYSIERSINGERFKIIGNTTATDYLDYEIKKTSKLYESYLKDVNVRYRIRAFSEWRDENNNLISQHSPYSEEVSIVGKYNLGPLEKRQNISSIPESNELSQNFPNPFNPSTTIYYAVKDAGIVSIKVFNSLGQEICTLVDDSKDAGYHYVEWNATGYPSGSYFYRIINGTFAETKKMILTK